jgi:hypothetical protein
MVALAASRMRLSHDPPVQWLAPLPLWQAIQRDELAQRRGTPALLRFASDDFTNEMLSVLASDPAQLRAYVAQPETWRAEDHGLDPQGRDKAATDDRPFKLFQAAHMRFYMVAGTLACRLPGVPDRTINPACDETAFFVLRRLDANQREYGWATGRQAPANTGPHYQETPEKGWALVNNPATTLLRDEERFPLFPISFALHGATRRLLAGLVPVASRETSGSGAAALLPSPADSARVGGDPRPIDFDQKVSAPLLSIRDWYNSQANLAQVAAGARIQIEHGLAYALLDLLRALRSYAPTLHENIKKNAIGNPNSYGAASGLAGLINSATFPPINATPVALTRVLNVIEANEQRIDQELQPGVEINTLPGMATVWALSAAKPAFLAAWLATPPAKALIQTALEQALPKPYQPPANAGDQYPPAPQHDPAAQDEYIIRMVYERPQCKWPVLSAPTRAFQLAPFFDPDAPVRPIRIVMPVDTSTEGLKKYGKGVSFLISDQLRKQMDRVSGLKDLTEQKLKDEQSFDLGLICSFSIPIITICALILLLVIVIALNIVFFWLPFFKICLPIPLKRK